MPALPDAPPTLSQPRSDAKDGTRPLHQALPKSADSARTIAHRMADEVGAAIVNGDLADGARIREEELASHYGVSRSPVREAIGLLERRGLVRTEPRRGTYVVGFTPDLIADLFNVRGVLMGLATRYVALRHDPAALAELRAVADALQASARAPETTPLDFARQASALGQALLRHCGSDVLRRMVNDHGHLTSWGMIWRQRPVDFLTVARRVAMAGDYATFCNLLEAGNDTAAEAWMRKMLDDNRDHVLAELARWRGTRAKPIFLLRQPDG